MKKEVKLPTFAYPVKDPEHPCACQDRPIELTHKKGLLFWQVCVGDSVGTDTPIAVVEAEKKSVEIFAPEAGVLRELLVHDGDMVDADTVLAYLEVMQ